MATGRILMAFASHTGNTELITDILEEKLLKLGHDVEVKSLDFEEVLMDELIDYDALLIGTYSWNDGDLPDEAEDLYMDMEEADLTDYIVGVYGSGDSFYDTFGAAIKQFWHHAKELGAAVVDEPLVIDFEPTPEDDERFDAYVNEMTEAIAAKK